MKWQPPECLFYNHTIKPKKGASSGPFFGKADIRTQFLSEARKCAINHEIRSGREGARIPCKVHTN